MLHFYGSWLSSAFSGAWALSGYILFIINILIGFIIWKVPRWKRWHSKNKKYAWITPLALLIFLLVIRLPTVPYNMFITQQEAISTLQNELEKTQLELIVPKLQVKPTEIIDSLDATIIKMHMINYSDYAAKNIFIDIKFGDNLWKRELLTAQHKDELLHFDFEIQDQRVKEALDNYYNHSLIDELKPGSGVSVYMADEDKDFLSRLDVFVTRSDGTKIPISTEETKSYQLSQGWKEEIESINSGESINILIRIEWENEIGKQWDRTIEYQLICTKFGSGRSYNFLPTGYVIEDY